MHCPITVADETIPKDFLGRPVASTLLRRAIDAREHEINFKFGTKSKIFGCCRFSFFVNDLEAIRPSSEAMNDADMTAVASRYFVVLVNSNAKGYLQQLGGPAMTHNWIEGDARLVRYFLHVAATRHVEPKARGYLVEGAGADLADFFATGGTIAKLLLEVVATYVLDVPRRKVKDDPIVIADGQVLLRIRALHASWGELLRNSSLEARRTRPTQMDFAREVRALCGTETRFPYRSGPRYFPIRLSILEKFVEKTGADLADFRNRVGSSATEVKTGDVS
jgi:hypothetical protein